MVCGDRAADSILFGTRVRAMLSLIALAPQALSAPVSDSAKRVASSIALSKSVASSTTFRRAEFWDAGSATTLDVVNVLGRWTSPDEWSERTEFAIVEKASEMTADQAATLSRYEMAQRLGYVERVALQMNIEKLPFRDDKLAEAMGLEVKDFEELPINPVAVNVVFDALSESKSSMLPPDVITKRRERLFTEDGGLDELAFTFGLLKARFAVIVSWFVFGKGNIAGVLVLLKVISDTTGLFTDFYGTILRNQEGVLAATAMVGMMTYVGQQESANEERQVAERRNAEQEK